MKYVLIYILAWCTGIMVSCGQKNDQSRENLPSRVMDNEGIFTREQRWVLDSIIAHHENKTGNQIAIVSLIPDSVKHIVTIEEWEEYSIALFNRLGVGEKGKNNGVGILLSANLKRVRIEIGEGLIARFTSAEAQQIINELMVPFFRDSAYFYGVENGLEAIIRELE